MTLRLLLRLLWYVGHVSLELASHSRGTCAIATGYAFMLSVPSAATNPSTNSIQEG